MSEDNAHTWMIAAVMVAPPLLWWIWEMARAIRERIAIRRILRERRGDGMP